jgi:NADPH:quinone reductase-like Zn-dependent oxidoreductase
LTAEPAAIKSLFVRLVDMLNANQLRVPLEAAYPIDRLTEALAHAQRAGRGGKIVLQWLQ